MIHVWVWLKLVQWFWRRIFFNSIGAFSLFWYYLPLEKLWFFIWTWIPFTKECFAASLVEIGLVFLEKKMEMWKGESGELNTSDPWANSLNRETVPINNAFVQCYDYTKALIKREKRHYLNGPYMFKHKYPSPKVPSLIEIRPVVLEKNFINFLNVLFFNFVLISPWKRCRPSFEQNPRMLYAKFGWIWLNGSGEKYF